MNYKASIINELFTIIQKNPNRTVGELIHDIKVNMNGVSFFTATDEQIYNAVENTSNDDGQDLELTEEEFNEWCNKK